jgi:hypothetical protein
LSTTAHGRREHHLYEGRWTVKLPVDVVGMHVLVLAIVMVAATVVVAGVADEIVERMDN